MHWCSWRLSPKRCTFLLILYASVLAKAAKPSTPMSVEEMQDRIESQAEKLKTVTKYLRMTDYFWNWFQSNEQKLTAGMKTVGKIYEQNKSQQKELNDLKSQMGKIKETYEYKLIKLSSSFEEEATQRNDNISFLFDEVQLMKANISQLNNDAENIHNKYNSSISKILKLSRGLADSANNSIETFKKEAISLHFNNDNNIIKNELHDEEQNQLAQLEEKLQNIESQLQSKSSLAGDIEKLEYFKKETNQKLKRLEGNMKTLIKENKVKYETELKNITANLNAGKLERQLFREKEREFESRLRELNRNFTKKFGTSCNENDTDCSDGSRNPSVLRSLDLSVTSTDLNSEDTTMILDENPTENSSSSNPEPAMIGLENYTDGSSFVETIFMDVNVTSGTIDVDDSSGVNVTLITVNVDDSFDTAKDPKPTVALEIDEPGEVNDTDDEDPVTLKPRPIQEAPGTLYRIPPILSSSLERHRFIVVESPDVEYEDNLLPPRMISFKSLNSKKNKKRKSGN